MPNPISHLTIIHNSREDVQGVRDDMLEAAAESMQFSVALRNLTAALACGARSGTVAYRLESGTNITAASQTITLTDLPTANDTVTLGGRVLTFVASAANENQCTIGANATATATNLAAVINANSEFLGILSATSAAGVVTVTYSTPGRAGNLVTLAEAAANLTVGGDRLAGATAPQDSAPRTHDYGGTG